MTVALICRRRLVVGLATLPTLYACTTSPSPKLFTLTARSAASAGAVPKRVAVKSVEVAKYLDRHEIVRRTEGYELKTTEVERWAEGMRDMVTRVLVENLSLRLPSSQVFAEASPISVPPDVTVEVDISRFDGDANGAVILDARWAMQHTGRSGAMHWERIHVAPASEAIPHVVAAMSDALALLSDRIVREVAT